MLDFHAVAAHVDHHMAHALPAGKMGAFSLDQLAGFARMGLDIAVQYAGPTVEAAALAEKDAIQKVLSDATLDFFTKVLGELKASQN